MRFPIRILLGFIPQNDIGIHHSIGTGELSKKYKITKKAGVAQEEIRHEMDLFFHLMEQMVEICHQHEMIRIREAIHSRPIRYRSIKHITFIQLPYIARQTALIRSQQ